jgi:hypothetical protein
LTAAGVGAVGYAIATGAQWWNWEQFAVFQMVLLVLRRRLSAVAGRHGGAPELPATADRPTGPP